MPYLKQYLRPKNVDQFNGNYWFYDGASAKQRMVEIAEDGFFNGSTLRDGDLIKVKASDGDAVWNVLIVDNVIKTTTADNEIKAGEVGYDDSSLPHTGRDNVQGALDFLKKGVDLNQNDVFNNSGNLAIADIFADGLIGNAADTVDIYSFAIITQHTGNVTAILPPPTNPKVSRYFVVYSSPQSTAPFLMYHKQIKPGGGIVMYWNGTGWIEAASGLRRVFEYNSSINNGRGSSIRGSAAFVNPDFGWQLTPNKVNTSGCVFWNDKKFNFMGDFDVEASLFGYNGTGNGFWISVGGNSEPVSYTARNNSLTIYINEIDNSFSIYTNGTLLKTNHIGYSLVNDANNQFYPIKIKSRFIEGIKSFSVFYKDVLAVCFQGWVPAGSYFGVGAYCDDSHSNEHYFKYLALDC